MKINIVQDIATPHNNVVMAQLKQANIPLELWYCHEKPAKYNWTTDLTNAVQQARIYKSSGIDWALIKHVLTHKDEQYLIVGWMNPTTKLLLPLLWLLRRKFNMWFDYPQDEATRSPLKNTVRNMFYWLLKTSRAKVFGVGKMTLDYFKNRGFAEERLVNLPIFVDISKTKADYAEKIPQMRKKYGVEVDHLLFSTGSRLVHDKGYDLVIDAIAKLTPNQQKQVKCVIVGQGEEQQNLIQKIATYNLGDVIIMEDWLEFDDFLALIAASNVFLHPARFDAYGGTLFAHALGVPVIGSTTAGAAQDRIIHTQNGFLYPAEDTAKCAEHITWCLQNPTKLPQMGQNGRQTAEQWPPTAAVKILQENII